MNDFEFGNRLYELRRRTGLTQAELADKIGVTNKAVSKWENGKANPPPTYYASWQPYTAFLSNSFWKNEEGSIKWKSRKLSSPAAPAPARPQP